MLGLDQHCDVYGEGASTFDQVLKSDLRCRLAHVDATAASNTSDRAELLSRRRLLWDPADFAMPLDEVVQVVVDGERWQLVAGSFAFPHGPSGRVAYGAADAVRQV